MSIIKSGGLSEDNALYAERFLENVQILVKDLTKRHQSKVLSDFLSNKHCYEHGALTAFLASILAKEEGLISTKPQETLGLAAFFHDIGLLRLGEEFIDLEPSLMNPQQLKIYQTHPTVGAQEMQHLQISNPTMLQAITEHHMRLRGQGFPHRSGATPVHKMSEIIGICDEVSDLIRKAKSKNMSELTSEIESTIFPQFSQSLSRSVRKVLF